MNNNEDYRAIEIVPKWPCRGMLETAEEVPSALVGATIVAIGMPDDERLVEGGGLVIDFIPLGSTKPDRIVLAFTECGMWVERYLRS